MVALIREQIRVAGPVSFAWFMEQALYHPTHGYYSSGRAVIGRQGDYFTNVSVGPVFGRLMALQFAEMWRVLGEPAEFTIVEQGAHDGQFAHDLLAAAERDAPAFSAAIRYRIVEPFPALRARQVENLASRGERVQWSDSLDDVAPFCGVHFSNELLDAMPVNLVRWTGSDWLERKVTASEDGVFEFIDAPITDDSVAELLPHIPAPVAVGYETEVNVAALAWIDQIATKIKKGFVVAVDYGFPRDEFYAPHRTTGTLQCRARHRVIVSPFSEVGQADITAHVEWTSLAERAQARGLSLLGFTDQHHFIIGLLSESGAHLVQENEGEQNTRGLQTLLHPGFLGMKFQYLVLGKNVGEPAELAGLRFARDSRNAL